MKTRLLTLRRRALKRSTESDPDAELLALWGPDEPSTRPRGAARFSPLVLAVSIFGTIAVASTGSSITATSVAGNERLAPWRDAEGIIGPASVIAYVLAATALWLMWRQRPHVFWTRGLVLYLTQLLLATAWTAVTFALFPVVGAVSLWLGLGLMALVVALTVFAAVEFGRHSRLAGWMLAPYLVWLGYVMVLNVVVIALN